MQVPITFLIPVIKSLGLNPGKAADFLAGFSVDARRLFDVDHKIAITVFDQILLQSARISARPDIGMVQGSLVDLRHLGLIAWIMMNAQNLGQALDLYRRYNSIVCSGIQYSIRETAGQLRVRFTSSDPGRPLFRVLMDSVMASFHVLMGQLLGGSLPIISLSLPLADAGDSDRYREVFGIGPGYQKPDFEIRYAAGVLGSPVLFSDPSLLAHFTQKADLLMGIDPLSSQGPLSRRVRQLVLENIKGIDFKIGACAKILAMSTRNLQLHLHQEGTTFSALANQAYHDFACRELADSTMSVAEIAWLLGYADLSSFYGAFKKWTGQTPAQFRKTAQAEGSGKAVPGRD